MVSSLYNVLIAFVRCCGIYICSTLHLTEALRTGTVVTPTTGTLTTIVSYLGGQQPHSILISSLCPSVVAFLRPQFQVDPTLIIASSQSINQSPTTSSLSVQFHLSRHHGTWPVMLFRVSGGEDPEEREEKITINTESERRSGWRKSIEATAFRGSPIPCLWFIPGSPHHFAVSPSLHLPSL